MRWYKKAKKDSVIDAGPKPTFNGALPLEADSYYGGWVSPSGNIYLEQGEACHVRVGKALLNEKRISGLSEVYETLLGKGFLRIITRKLPLEIYIHCENPEDFQKQQILSLIATLPPETEIILQGKKNKSYSTTVAEFRAKHTSTPKINDLLGRGGVGDVWKKEDDDSGFSAFAKNRSRAK